MLPLGYTPLFSVAYSLCNPTPTLRSYGKEPSPLSQKDALRMIDGCKPSEARRSSKIRHYNLVETIEIV